jgi:hypothetical protein
MKRYILQNNRIKDTKTNEIIGAYLSHESASEMVEHANRGAQEDLDDAEWIKEQKELYDKGGHIAGLSDW